MAELIGSAKTERGLLGQTKKIAEVAGKLALATVAAIVTLGLATELLSGSFEELMGPFGKE